MKAWRIGILAMMTSACAGTGERAIEDEPTRPTPEARASTTTANDGFEWSHSPYGSVGHIVHNYNYTLVVDDPGKALAKARAVVLGMGAEITHASSTVDNANLSAMLPPGDHARLRGALAELAIRVDSESVGRSDYGASIDQAKRRLARIESARMHIVAAMRESSSREAADAFSLLMELSEQERNNLESQLQSWREQTRGSQLYLAFVREPSAPIDD